MDKLSSKQIFIKNKILTPKFIIFKNSLSNIKSLKKEIKKLKFPVVIKPINEGSSVDVYISTEKNIKSNISKLYKHKEILIEEFIGGREIQVAILGKKNLVRLNLNLKENSTIIKQNIIPVLKQSI